jgi:acetylglutamate kinase
MSAHLPASSCASSSSSSTTYALIKVGGEVVADAAHLAGLAHNLRGLVAGGHRVVVVHGGGPQVSDLQEKLGQKVTKVAGQRVTSADDIFAVTASLAGNVNVTLCAALVQAGVRAFGCHGASGAMIACHKREPLQVAGHGLVDYGEVGDVDTVDTAGLMALCDAGYVPVVATLGIDAAAGRVLNVNGDSAAAAVAKALPAALVVLVTGVGGVFRDRHDPGTRLARLTVSEARGLISEGVIADGMIPKVQEALTLLSHGVGCVAIASAMDPSAFAALASGTERADAHGTRLLP